MALKNLFDMAKADKYTADGREALIKAQEAETEDKVYQIGEISQKTGLQKTANGWVKPPRNKEIQNAGKHSESVKAAQKAKKEEARRQQRAEGEANARAFQEKVEKGEIKPAAENKTTIRQGPNTKTLNETPAEHVQKNLDAYKGYQPYDMEELVLKPSGYERQTSARVPGGGQSITYTKNGAEDITLFFDRHGELENADVAGSKPAAGNNLSDIPDFKGMESGDYDNKLRAEGWTTGGWEGNGTHSSAIFKKGNKTIRVNEGKPGTITSVEEISKDAAPRVLTGDTRIRVRKA